MKKNLLLLMMLLAAAGAYAQNTSNESKRSPNVEAAFQTTKPKVDSPSLTLSMLCRSLHIIADSNLYFLTKDYPKLKLASQYTFRNLVKADFSTVTIADNSATVGQFAALSIDPNSYKLAFSPIAWAPQGKSLATKDFKNVYAVNFTGTLNNQSLLDLKQWRNVTGSFTFTHLIGEHYRFANVNTNNSNQVKANDYKKPYRDLYQELIKRDSTQFASVYGTDNHVPKDRVAALNHPEYASLEDARQAYLDSIAKYEQLYTSSTWTAKSFWWYKLTLTPLSFDNAYYVVKDDPATYDSPKQATVWTGTANASINFFKGFAKHLNFYVNLNAQIGQKDMFTGIYTPETYNGFSRLTDTSLIQKTNEQVFRSPKERVGTRILPDFGGELILLYSFPRLALGLDVNYTYSVVMSNEDNYRNGFISTPSAGVILGLKDKNGKSNINIEPYFQFQDFRHVSVSSQHLVGIKFSLPINSLY